MACPSGRRCNTRNVVWGQTHRGFKSHRHRQITDRQGLSLAVSDLTADCGIWEARQTSDSECAGSHRYRLRLPLVTAGSDSQFELLVAVSVAVTLDEERVLA